MSLIFPDNCNDNLDVSVILLERQQFIENALADLYGDDETSIEDDSIFNEDDVVDTTEEVSEDETEYVETDEGNEVVEESVDEESSDDAETETSSKKERKRINTQSMLDNTGFYNAGMNAEIINTTTIAISPLIEEQYDYSVTDDIVLLQDRADTNEVIYDIFINSPFADCYMNQKTGLIKIPKEDISKVFYYTKDKLLKRKKLTAYEVVISINEFYEFNYDYIVKKVLSSKMMSEILNDYYNNLGMKSRIDENSTETLF